MKKDKKKITDSMVVPANGRPEQVKVGYRKIKIKEIMFSVVNSNILKKDCFYKFNFW